MAAPGTNLVASLLGALDRPVADSGTPGRSAPDLASSLRRPTDNGGQPLRILAKGAIGLTGYGISARCFGG